MSNMFDDPQNWASPMPAGMPYEGQALEPLDPQVERILVLSRQLGYVQGSLDKQGAELRRLMETINHQDNELNRLREQSKLEKELIQNKQEAYQELHFEYENLQIKLKELQAKGKTARGKKK